LRDDGRGAPAVGLVRVGKFTIRRIKSRC
jgi:hypothetical protein